MPVLVLPVLLVPVAVVMVKVPETHPIVNVALVLLDGSAEDMTRSTTESHELTDPVNIVKGELLIL